MKSVLALMACDSDCEGYEFEVLSFIKSYVPWYLVLEEVI